MGTMTERPKPSAIELARILYLHGKWRRGEAEGARANLAGADLARANLAGAYLADANLAGADLAGAKNIPTGIEAKDPPEPYSRNASRAERAKRYRERHPGVPVVEQLDSKILRAVTNGEGRLDMSQWHSCDTTHCRAGWAIHLAGERGYELERQHNPRIAGAMIYRASTGRAPHFFATNERAMEDIRRCAAEEQQEAQT